MRKLTPQKLWMLLIACVSLYGSYSLLSKLYDPQENLSQDVVLKSIGDKVIKRRPASAPMEDGAASGK